MAQRLSVWQSAMSFYLLRRDWKSSEDSPLINCKHMMESGIRREDRKKFVDEIAAVFILQGYLDYLAMHPEEK